jgi:hypothetical protein
LTIIQTHPGGGQYDCLAVYESKQQTDAGPGHLRQILDINRTGSMHIGGDALVTDWCDEFLAADNAHTLIKTMEHAVGMSAPARTPDATERTLTVRVLAALAWAGVNSKNWRPIESARFDSSEGVDEGLMIDDRLASAASDRLSISLADDIRGQAAYRFWLVPCGAGSALVETSATAWLPNGEILDLMAMYRAGQRPTQIAAAIGKDYLP